MKFNTFKELVRKYPLFPSRIFSHLTQDVASLRRQISEWQAKGWLLELKRGLYTLPEQEHAQGSQLSTYFLAHQLYSPSYISLETALSYYGFIPERVAIITSISSKKTQTFNNSFGCFKYYHIKPALYDHFVQKTDEFGYSFFIALPERALLDFFYFRMKQTAIYTPDVFDLSLRLQNLENLDLAKLDLIAKQFNSPKINHLLRLFHQFLGK